MDTSYYNEMYILGKKVLTADHNEFHLSWINIFFVFIHTLLNTEVSVLNQ